MKRMLKSIILTCCFLDITLVGYAQLNAFEEKILQAHNYWRKEYKIQTLTWNEEVAKGAQIWSEKLAANGCNLQHSPYSERIGQGENLFGAYGNSYTSVSDVKGEWPVDSWAEERFDYNFETNTCKSGKVCGHFTQLIWGNTKEVGCGIALGNNCIVVTCRYAPPGNYIGQRPIPSR